MSDQVETRTFREIHERKLYAAALHRVSSVDGREVLLTHDLSPYLSEGALHRHRAMVVIDELIALSESDLAGKPVIYEKEKARIRAIAQMDTFDAFAVAEYDQFGRNGLEPTEHDVKAVELYLRERLDELGLGYLKEWLRFPMTSEDDNNLAWNLMLRGATNKVWLPALLSVMDKLAAFAKRYADTPVLGITHGMTASPTTFGKRFSYTLSELSKVLDVMRKLKLTGKFGGAVGNHNAVAFVVPNFDIETFSKEFVESFGFVYDRNTHQRNSHQAIVRFFHEVKMVNTWLIDFCANIRHNVMMGWLGQVGKPGRVGSSIMPHKINPWYFEVAQGYLEQANIMIDGMAAGLMKSTFERDLTDHPWERAYGEVIAKSLLSIRYIDQGLDSLRVNDADALADLNAAPEILSEAVQIAGRYLGVPNVYMVIKNLTRGQALTLDMLRQIIAENIPESGLRDRLMRLTPADYTGKACHIAQESVAEYHVLRESLAGGILDTASHIRAVLFDFDNTLHHGDKEELQARLEGINERLDLGFTATELQAFGDRSDFREMRAIIVREYNARHAHAPVTAQQFDEVNDAVSGSFDDRFQLAPHAQELLALLRATGRKTGLVTTRGNKSLVRLLKHHGIADCFDVIVGRDDCKERKPHPQPIALALEKLGIKDPTSAMYVGDKQLDDIIAGKALGLETVLVGKDTLDAYGARPTYHFETLTSLVHRFQRRAEV